MLVCLTVLPAFEKIQKLKLGQSCFCTDYRHSDLKVHSLFPDYCKIASVILCYLLASLFKVRYFLFAVASDSNFRNHSVLVSENACAQFLHL